VSESNQQRNGAQVMIHLEHLSKVFGGQREPAVADLSMDIPQGEIVILVGPSGCGKSTTLRLINRLIEPSGGRIVIGDDDVTGVNSDELRRSIGYVIQQIGLFPHMTIAQNIATVPRMLGWKKQRIAERVDELLEMVGMEAKVYRGRYPKELSGGQSQRIGVARAMAADPPILLMDEPFSALDAITRDEMNVLMLDLWERYRKTALFVTHSIREAVLLSDRVLVMGGQPATIIEDVRIPFPRPRDFGLTEATEFNAICGHLRAQINKARQAPQATVH
jgi:osmoprotectant transport system ATP-binding protein